MTQDELLKLAQTILKEIKAEVICSHDIISSLELKHIYLDEIDNYRKNYPNFAQCLRYHDKIKAIRKIVDDYVFEKRKSFSSPQTVCLGTIARFGVGECSELATLAVIKLLKNKCYTAAHIQIEDAENSHNNHCFIIIGQQLEHLGGVALSTDNLMQQLITNNSVILDPFLDHASCYTEKSILTTYIESYNLKKIRRFTIFNEKHLTLVDNWIRCIDETYQHLKNLGEIKAPLQKDSVDAYGNLISQIEPLLRKYHSSNVEKGLRNAAANGNMEDVKSFCHLLKNNINAQDNNPNSRKTALHWAAIKGHQQCYDFLIASGANASILDANGNKADDYLMPIASIALTT